VSEQAARTALEEPGAAADSPAPLRGSGAVAVALSGLRRTYGGVAAVDGIDVEIADGEFFSLIGPSGCGKTTTLRMIAGFVEPSAGRIVVHGRDVTEMRPHRRPVNTVFQHYALFPHLDVFENVAFGLRERRERRDVVRDRVHEMLDLVDLRGRERAKPAQLSGGQQQRVALARALVLRPEVLLLDEPLGALDLKLRKQLQLQLKRIQHEVGITFIYVTHDQEEAFFMSDRVAIMREGRIEQLGRPQEVYERPQTEFVADFVGAANRIAALVVAVHADGTYDAELDGVGAVRAPGVGGLRAGQRVCAVVRPEVITPTDEAPPGCAYVACRVTDLAYLGDHVSAVVELPGGSQLTLSVREQRAALALDARAVVCWPFAATWLLAADAVELPPAQD
jgi:spermidine/putrescine transport system ATP-binding protein